MTLYREIISKALAAAWRYKYLWILAFFASLAGNGGEYELLFSGSDSISGQSYLLGILRAFYTDGSLKPILENVKNFFGTYPIPSIFLALLLILLTLLLIWLVIVAQAALVWAIYRLQNKSQASFQESFSTGAKFFSPIFLVNLVTKALIFAVIFLLAVPLGIAYIRTGLALYNGLYIVLVFIAIIPLAFILSFLAKYATNYIMLRNQAWREALRNGWRLFMRNWLVSLEMGFLLFAFNVISSLLLAFLLLMLGLITNPAGSIVFFVILTVFGAFLATFQYHAWVQLFLALEAGTVKSKILRWTDALARKKTSAGAKAG